MQFRLYTVVQSHLGVSVNFSKDNCIRFMNSTAKYVFIFYILTVTFHSVTTH